MTIGQQHRFVDFHGGPSGDNIALAKELKDIKPTVILSLLHSLTASSFVEWLKLPSQYAVRIQSRLHPMYHFQLTEKGKALNFGSIEVSSPYLWQSSKARKGEEEYESPAADGPFRTGCMGLQPNKEDRRLFGL